MSDIDEWNSKNYEAAYVFAAQCARLYLSPPAAEIPLMAIVNTLVTELWDRNFSQQEITRAFESAISDLPRYAAGQQRRNESANRPSTNF